MKKITLRLKKVLKKTIPLWLAILIVLNSSMVVALAQAFLMRQEFQRLVFELSSTTKNSDDLIQILKQEVLPSSGYTTSLSWKNLGSQLVEAGAIDKKKYEEIFKTETDGKNEMKYLDGSWNDKISINENNARFMVNTFWALGLTNKSKVLDEGSMRTSGTDTSQFASTGGWTLGQKKAMEIYSSKEIILLTDKQQDLVKKIASNIYRPCCNNSTAFPDCNHGMAALGYIEWAVYNGLSEKQIYKDLLFFNSFWFPQTYVEMAVYFDKQGTKWKDVDAKTALSFDYSSAQGASRISQTVQNVPGLNKSQGGGCGA